MRATAIAAYYLIASGFHRRVLCIGFEKQSEGSAQSSITTVGDPIWERAVMAGAIGNFAAMTSVYVNESGVTAEQAAKVAVKARRNACLNPHAQLKMPDITVEQVLASDMLALPGAACSTSARARTAPAPCCSPRRTTPPRSRRTPPGCTPP